MACTLFDLALAKRTASKAIDAHRARFLLDMQTAIGQGTADEQLVRLMVWTSARLSVGETHTRLEHPIEILLSREAWCDQHVRVFLWGVKELLGLKGRILVLSHTDGKSGHTVCEVDVNGKWVLFDPHPFHVACYRGPDGTLLSFEDIRKDISVVVSEQHWWRAPNGGGKEQFFINPAEINEVWHERPLSIIR